MVAIVTASDLFPDLGVSYRYWRCHIVDRQNPLGPEGVGLGYGYIGDTVETVTNVGSRFAKPIVDPSTTQTSEGGAQYFNERVRFQRIQNAVYQVIGESDRLILERISQKFGITQNLFISLDPEAKVSPDVSSYTFYGRFERDPQPVNLFRDKWQWTFNFREAV